MFKRNPKETEIKDELKAFQSNSKLSSQGRKIWKHRVMQGIVCRVLNFSILLMEVTYRMY
jgi:hypothetical protein